jgi:ADP-heptose:LPS heptosyltransferase
MHNKIRWLIKKIIPVYNTFFNKKKRLSDNIIKADKIAYFLDGGIGDAIMAYPAIRFLRKSFPESELKIFVSSKIASVLSPIFDTISLIPVTSMLLFTLQNIFSRRKIDVSFMNVTAIFNVSIELAAYFSSKNSFGFRYPDEKEKQRLFANSSVFSESTHFAEQNLQLVSDNLNSPFEKSDIELSAKTTGKNASNAMDIIIHPGSKRGYENKRWLVENFKEIVNRLIEKGYFIKVLLGPGERYLETQFQNGKHIQIIVEPEITKLIGAFKHAALFIGNDSGPAHLAAFYGIPGITLFGPEDPRRSAPLGEATISVYNGIDCSPCHFKQKICEDNRCMKSITVDQVWKEVEKSLLTH